MKAQRDEKKIPKPEKKIKKGLDKQHKMCYNKGVKRERPLRHK
jgi:hypothetical protein